MDRWQRLVIVCSNAHVEAVESELQTFQPAAITISADKRSAALFDQHDNQHHLWEVVEVHALFDISQDISEAMQTMSRLGIAARNIRTERLADQDWISNWEADLQPLDFGNGLFICPHSGSIPSAARTVVKLETGMAFGTGTHPTTAMCLQWLARQKLGLDTSVLDFGCGSGVLAIAAAKLGAGKIAACDIDPEAVTVSIENAAMNEAQGILVTLNSALALQPNDVVMANILLEPLIAEKATLVSVTKSGSQLLLSGILVDQSEKLIAAFSPEFNLRVEDTREDWALLLGVRI